MSHSHLFVIPFLFQFLLLPVLSALGSHCATPPLSGSQLQVLHLYSPCSPFRHHLSWADTLLDMESKDQARLQYLSSLVARRSIVPIASARRILNNPTYIVHVRVGTPPQSMLMAMDTSNDAAWIPCTGCVGCPASTLFNTRTSTSYSTFTCKAAQCKQVPNSVCANSSCSFGFTYGSSSVTANLSRDAVTLANNDTVPGFTFGCVLKANGSSMPAQGLLGLGRGPLSLISQTHSLYKSTFSYCLPSFTSPSFTGSLRLGPVAQPKRIKFTPLLTNPRRSSLYYVNLIGIRVGRRVVDVPPSALAFNPTTGAGTIIDSGTVFTRLVEPAYRAVRDAFRRRIGNATVTSLGGFDTCYASPITAPTITFMFAGMNVTLPQENLLIHSTAGGTSCLAMAAAPANVNSVVNVIANMQQQNHRILFDIPNSRIGVARERCT
uniref:Peptidase A1 domain-containing protein n=1 Tax=Kalanchoe fedtschenkoi TaxID=63787 RepID=A0A7N0TXU6_KALFE